MTAATSAASRLLDTTVDIETPEHVYFRYHVAGPARRALAYAIDLLARAALALAALIVALAADVTAGGAGLGTGVWFAVLFVVEWLYYVVSELVLAGQSIGKRALDLRVVKEDGTAVELGDAVLRNLLRAADFLPAMYALGLVVMGRDRAFRRLGDLAAGTLVVHEGRGQLAPPIDLATLPVARTGLDPDLSVAELEAIEALARRRTSLSAARLRELCAILAPSIARRAGISYTDPAELLLGLYRRAVERRA